MIGTFALNELSVTRAANLDPLRIVSATNIRLLTVRLSDERPAVICLEGEQMHQVFLAGSVGLAYPPGTLCANFLETPKEARLMIGDGYGCLLISEKLGPVFIANALGISAFREPVGFSLTTGNQVDLVGAYQQAYFSDNWNLLLRHADGEGESTVFQHRPVA